jgi:AbrB family looped-hinge helix DNA binding protein
MDKAGRVVIPKSLRQALGFEPGDVNLVADGAGIRIELATAELVEQDGLLVLVQGSALPSGDELRELRLADQR